MYNMTRDFGRKGSVISGISAVDIALWDIAGKFYGQPIYKLLGGAFRQQVKPYATGFYRIKGQGEAQRLADEAIRHFEAGFTHMKVKLGYGVDDDIACMHAIGKAIQGKPIKLMIDTNHAALRPCGLGAHWKHLIFFGTRNPSCLKIFRAM
jgi:D-galactarolactone cycloisomerase